MSSYPLSLLTTGGARTGIAPVNLLEVQTVAGDIYCWSDRPVSVPSVILAAQASGYLVPSPPVPIPAGQGVVWALPTAISLGVGNLGVAGMASAKGDAATPSASAWATLTAAEGGGGIWPVINSAWAIWSGFTLPAWAAVPETEIVGIYPVVIATAVNALLPSQGDQGDVDLNAGYGLAPGNFGGFITNAPGGTPWGSYAGGVNGPSIGVSLSELEGMGIGANILFQGSHSGPAATLSVSFVGFAIYYKIPGAGGYSGAPVSWTSLTGPVSHAPWLLSVPQISFHRSLQTDTGSFVVQNLSGDTLSRDMEKLLRASAFEGALFVYRLWQADAEAAWIEVHGTLSVDDVGVDTITFKGTQLLNPSQDDTPLENYCETCQLLWGGIRCGASGSTECSYSYQTCQVIERIMVVMNDYEKNYGEGLANTALNVTNRRRLI